jgi:hypothetical protein
MKEGYVGKYSATAMLIFGPTQLGTALDNIARILLQ